MKKKLFDFVVGNPPYQESNPNNNRATPVYNLFMEAAFEVSDCVEVITPARFLFDAGQTPKAWNEKMLNDGHFKVLHYEADASKVFPSTEIKGGVAVTIKNDNKEYGKIGIFTKFDELNSILQKVLPDCKSSLTDICVGAVPYHYSEAFKNDHPECVELAGESFDLRTNALDKLADKAFFETPQSDQAVRIYGIHDRERVFMYIDSKYITTPVNFNGYKVLVSKANGAGEFGEILSPMIIAPACSGHTQSFISIGNFNTEQEAVNLEKYIRGKFARCMLDVLKTTQDTTPYKWRYVPLQNFTTASDIDWSKPIPEIDRALYAKYSLSADEIEFIETHVKEMN